MATIHGNDWHNTAGFLAGWWFVGLSGTDGNDFIYGHGGNDDLLGNNGDDWLDGGTGIDQMEGGAGNDTYIVDNVHDKVLAEGGVIFGGNSGYDTVKSYVSYTLPSGVEQLELFEDEDAIYGYGNELDNFISGNSYNNVLAGYEGEDELRGFGGDDLLYAGTREDTLYGGEGRDRLYGGNDNDTLYGGSENDELYGEHGRDDLFGGSGADTMYGGPDNDEYEVNNAGDVVVEYDGEGTLDNVRSTVSYTLTANVENLTLIGTARDGTGNSLPNNIIGNAQNNTLNGGRGNDLLRGEGGRDHFVFDTALRGNIDIIGDFNPADDTIVLDNAVFTTLPLTPGVDLRGLNPDEFSAEFRLGTRLADASVRIMYDWSTGDVFYDSDGIYGFAPPVHFASIGAGLNVTHLDFHII
jgi:Ca2+-binding RTX toxin-like protein